MATAKNPQKGKVDFPRRGEIFLVNFDPTVGHEIKKIRPALVIQNDVSNQYSPLTTVVAITSQFTDPPHPREVIIEMQESGLSLRSAVIVNRIRSIDRFRFTKRIGKLSPSAMAKVDQALRISLGLVKF